MANATWRLIGAGKNDSGELWRPEELVRKHGVELGYDDDLPLKREIGHVSSIATGLDFVVLLTHDAKVYTYGRNHKYQLGHPHCNQVVAKPTRVTFPLEHEEERIIEVKCGAVFSSYLSNHGNVYTAGAIYRDLGNFPKNKLSKVLLPDDSHIHLIGCGRFNLLVQDENTFTVYSIGDIRSKGSIAGPLEMYYIDPSSDTKKSFDFKLKKLLAGTSFYMALTADLKLLLSASSSTHFLFQTWFSNRNISIVDCSCTWSMFAVLDAQGRVYVSTIVEDEIEDTNLLLLDFLDCKMIGTSPQSLFIQTYDGSVHRYATNHKAQRKLFKFDYFSEVKGNTDFITVGMTGCFKNTIILQHLDPNIQRMRQSLFKSLTTRYFTDITFI